MPICQRIPYRVLVLCAFLLQTMIPSTAQTPASPHIRYKLIDVGTFGGPNSAETVEFPFVNDTGMVVGFADTPTPDPFSPGAFLSHAFRWQRGVLTDLGTLPDGIGSFAVWSNNKGQVVGLSANGLIDPASGFPEGRGVLWDKTGAISDLGTLGGDESLAFGIIV